MALVAFQSCFTGVENTKKIELSRQDRKQTALMAEDTFMNSVNPSPHTSWQKGKRFYATDNRTAMIFDSDHLTADIDKLGLGGKVLLFSHTENRTALDGSKKIAVVFTDGNYKYVFSSGKETHDTLFSTEIPLMIDLDIVDMVSEKLKGLRLWTRSPIWYDMEGEMTNGRKFVPVTITKILPGDKVFPLKVNFTDDTGKEFAMFMNIGNSGIESRSFANIFYLSDPRSIYPDIEPDVWTLIQNGNIRIGMTKDECRLALGAPKEINQGHNYSSTLELWQYSDGVYLQFQDGILVNFRQ